MKISAGETNFHGQIVKRPISVQKIIDKFKVTPCVALLGPRQCGKTTQARVIASQYSIPPQNYFDLEKSTDIQRLADPLLTLSALQGLIVIDEIQAVPELFRTLRVLIDDASLNQQYLILGSASRELIRQSSETLAGRLSYLELTPFHYLDTKEFNLLWLRGGFPLAYLANNDEISFDWRQSYIKTYLEQDIPKLGIDIPAENLRRLWMMLAHVQGNTLNSSDFSRSLDLGNKTIRHYLDVLSGTFMIRQLQPWFENISKRQVKAPKVYIRDTGILHALLGIHCRDDLLMNPKLGASWESFVLEQLIILLGVDPLDCYYWRTHQGAELDLLIHRNGKRCGYEIKYTSAPRLAKSMQVAMGDLKLDSLTVIYPGEVDYPLTEKIRVVSFKSLLEI